MGRSSQPGIQLKRNSMAETLIISSNGCAWIKLTIQARLRIARKLSKKETSRSVSKFYLPSPPSLTSSGYMLRRVQNSATQHISTKFQHARSKRDYEPEIIEWNMSPQFMKVVVEVAERKLTKCSWQQRIP